MARYIDADKLIAHLKDEIKECEIPLGSRANGKSIAYGTALGLKSAISFAETLSTADVAPKSEVDALEKEIERLTNILNSYALQYGTATDKQKGIDKAKAEVAREIFEEVETCLEYEYMSYLKAYDYTLLTRIEELKKKYTEEKDEDKN